MLFKPHCLSRTTLSKEELVKDRKNCRKFGPCGVGEKAIYLNSFYFDRRYYIPLSNVKRIFKRVVKEDLLAKDYLQQFLILLLSMIMGKRSNVISSLKKM